MWLLPKWADLSPAPLRAQRFVDGDKLPGVTRNLILPGAVKFSQHGHSNAESPKRQGGRCDGPQHFGLDELRYGAYAEHDGHGRHRQRRDRVVTGALAT